MIATLQFIAIIICIFLYGISSFFRKLSLERLHPLQIQIIATFIYAGLAPIYFWYLKSLKNENLTYTFRGILYTCVMVSLYTIANIIFGFMLRKSNSLGVMSAMVSVSPIVTLILSMIFLSEEITLMKIVGAIVSIIGVFLLAI